MRRLLHGDVSNAARALMASAPECRQALCQQMLREAELADQHVQRTGRLHPKWGNGSLMMAARKYRQATEPGFDDIEFIECFQIVLEHLRQALLKDQPSTS